jgi:hypothetical protein
MPVSRFGGKSPVGEFICLSQESCCIRALQDRREGSANVASAQSPAVLEHYRTGERTVQMRRQSRTLQYWSIT